MSTYRLKTNSRLHKKVEELFDYMDKKGLKIEIGPYGKLIIHERGFDGEFELVDLDNNDPIGSIPPEFEFKLIFEKEN